MSKISLKEAEAKSNEAYSYKANTEERELKSNKPGEASNILISEKSLKSEEDLNKRNDSKKQDEVIEETPTVQKPIENRLCTAYKLGNEPIWQKLYYCTICDPKSKHKLCKNCYLSCHKVCRVTFNEDDEYEAKGECEFYCYCGINIKHKPETPQKKNLIPCRMKHLDIVLGVVDYYCMNHEIYICCICSVTCHRNCKIKKVFKKEKEEQSKCQCEGEKHTEENALGFDFPLEKYKVEGNVDVWPVQIINIIFSDENLYEKIQKLLEYSIGGLNKELQRKGIDQIKLANKLNSFLGVFAYGFNRKFKTFYFCDEIMKIFDYKEVKKYVDLIDLMNQNKGVLKTQIPLLCLIKIRLLICLFYIHLKKDFQIFKTFTSIDFITCTILERIQYKTMVMNSEKYYENLHGKYNTKDIFEDEDHPLKQLLFKNICELIENAIDIIDINTNQIEFEFLLKYICFMLKKQFLNCNELIKLTNSIFIFHKKFFDLLKADKMKVISLIDVFATLVEILFLIAVCYNDNIIYNYLESGDKRELSRDFIQVNSDQGSTLFKMILKSVDIVNQHYILIFEGKDLLKQIKKKKILNFIKKLQDESISTSKTGVKNKIPPNGGLLYEKIISLFNEELKIFSTCENCYMKQLKGISENDIYEHDSFCEKIINKNFPSFDNQDAANQIINIVFRTKAQFESNLNTLFTTSYKENSKINKAVYEGLIMFSVEMKNFFSQIKSIEESKPKEMNEEREKLKEEAKSHSKSLNAQSQQKSSSFKSSVKEFDNELVGRAKKYYHYLSLQTFQRHKHDFIDILIISQIDETLSKIFVFFSHRDYPNLLANDLLELILNFLTQFLLTERGLRCLLVGKIIQRLNKVFSRYNCKKKNLKKRDFYKNLQQTESLLNFLDIFSRSIIIANINLTEHKVLKRFKKNLLEHVEELCKVSLENSIETEFKVHLTLVMKIFYNLGKQFIFEDYEEIKNRILFIFRNNFFNLLKNDDFLSCFEEVEQDDLSSGDDESSMTNFWNLKGKVMKAKRIQHGDSPQETLFKSKDHKHYPAAREESEIDPEKLMLLKENQGGSFSNSISHSSTPMTSKSNFFIAQSDAGSEGSNQEKKLFTNLYFALFNLIADRTFYLFNDPNDKNLFIDLYKFNSLENYLKIFKTNQMTLSQRKIMLRYLRTIYFIDRLDEYSINKQKHYLTTIEYKQLIESNTIVEQSIGDSLRIKGILDLSRNIVRDLRHNYYTTNQLEQVLKIIISELEMLPEQFSIRDSVNIIEVEDYLIELLFTIKYVANFLYREINIWMKISVRIYDLTVLFIRKIEIFKRLFNEIENYSKIITHDKTCDIKNERAQEVLKNITVASYNIYNKKELYVYLTEFIDDVLAAVQLKDEISIGNYLERFDLIGEEDFNPFSLIEILDYEYFYDYDKKDEALEENELMSDAMNNFVSTYQNVPDTNLINVITNVSNEELVVDYREKMIKYFKHFINSREGNERDKLLAIISTCVKMMYYDDEMKTKCKELILCDKEFWDNINKVISFNIVILISLSRNQFAYKETLAQANLTKLLIQFVQLLGEGFNTEFHEVIFKREFEEDENNSDETSSFSDNLSDSDKKPDDKEIKEEKKDKGKKIKVERLTFRDYSAIPNVEATNTIYENIIINLKRVILLFEVEFYINAEMQNDKLITLLTNLTDMVIEYIETKDNSITEIIDDNMSRFFFGYELRSNENVNSNWVYERVDSVPILPKLFARTKHIKCSSRLTVLCYLKIKLVQLLSAYLQNGKKGKFIQKLIKNNCGVIDLYIEILYIFKALLKKLKQSNEGLYSNLVKIKNDDDFVEKLIEYYCYERVFRNFIEFQLCIKLFILIKIVQNMYNRYELEEHFIKMENEEKLLKENKEKDENFNWGIRSNMSVRLYKFLNKIVISVEVKGGDEEDSDEDVCEGYHEIINFVVDKLSSTKGKKENEKDVAFDDNSSTGSEVVQNQNKGGSSTKVTFFLRPYLTFSLSSQSKVYFTENVDRETATAKFADLLTYSDYFLFEMIINHISLGKKNNIEKKLCNLNYFRLEILNYCITVIQNVLIMYHFYRSHKSEPSEYDIMTKSMAYHINLDNLIISCVQIVFCLTILIIFIIFGFSKKFALNIIKGYNHSVIFKGVQQGELSSTMIDLFKVENENKKIKMMELLSEITKGIPRKSVIYTAVFSTFFWNREVATFLYTIILLIIYITTKCSLVLAIMILFVANLIQTLFDIFKAIVLKFRTIITVLLFTYLIIYLFMWITYFYMADLFVFDDILENESNSEITESFCYSSIQCLLYMIQQGLRAGGGIGDMIGKVSFQSDVYFFIGKFFYDMLFFVIIILVLGNVFMGIIVDTFGELMEDNSAKEDDINNVCFICQLSRNDSMVKGVDFDDHTKNVHDVWHYVYFLTYLHIGNQRDFTRIEAFVWEKIVHQDYSWIPILDDE